MAILRVSIDLAKICEAIQRPDMRFVPIKDVEHGPCFASACNNLLARAGPPELV